MERIIRGCAVKLLREPILQFLVIGALIFGLYGVRNDGAAPAPVNRITVTAGDVERLRAAWSRQWQRPPTAAEMKDLVDAHVREEVLYREALALGLDRDDAVIRRRLVQKLAFLTEDLSTARGPTQAELRAYFEANRERYRVPSRLSFAQVCFSPDRRGGGGAARDAGAALASLQAGTDEAIAVGPGDCVMLDDTYQHQTAQDIAAVFGPDFAEAMSRLDPGTWSGPIVSGYGLHLVRIEERIAGRVPTLGEIDGQVRNDWLYDQRRRANDAIVNRLLSRYEVVVEAAPERVRRAHSGAER